MSDVVTCVVLNRANLSDFLAKFKRSVALFELLERGGGPPSVGVWGGEFIQYRIIAARDGALNLYHFGCSLDALRTLTSTYKPPRIDPKKLRNAAKQFRAYFPNIESVRHAIAHAGELYDSPSKLKSSESKTDQHGKPLTAGSGIVLVASIHERRYSVGIDGNVFSVHLDNASVEKLQHVLGLAEEAFSSPAAPSEPPAEN